jgi:hypothetical protein
MKSPDGVAVTIDWVAEGGSFMGREIRRHSAITGVAASMPPDPIEISSTARHIVSTAAAPDAAPPAEKPWASPSRPKSALYPPDRAG